MIAWIALALAGLAGAAAASLLVLVLTRLSRLRREVEGMRATTADLRASLAANAGLAEEQQAMKQVLQHLAARLEADLPPASASGRQAYEGRAERQGAAGPAAGSAIVPDLAREVQAAVEGNRVDIYLQPIVTLPQRQVWSMAATTVLRNRGGTALPDALVRPLVRRLGLAQELDNLLLLRCVQMVRRMKRRPRPVGLFCDLAPASLEDADFFAQFAEYLETDGDLPDFLVFQVPFSVLERADEVQRLRLRHLTDLGFRLSVDGVENPRFSATELAQDGITFVCIDSAAFLAEGEGADGDADDPAPESDWQVALDALRREELVPIVAGITQEGQVPALLERGVALAKGPLFGNASPAGSEP